MANTPALYPGSAPTDNNGIGTIAWTNPDRAQSQNDSGATVSLASKQTSHYLVCVNYVPSIGSGDQIDGVVCEIRGRQTAGDTGATDNNVAAYLVDESSTIHTEAPKPVNNPFTGSFAYFSLGGSTDPWFTQTGANVNAVACGVALKIATATGKTGTFEIDTVRMTYYFTAAAVSRAPNLLLMGVGSILSAASAWLGYLPWLRSKLWHASYWLRGGRWLTCTKGIA